jgi:hypothetical protein
MNQVQNVTASFHAIALLEVPISSQATSFQQNCAFSICFGWFATFTQSKARVTITDTDTAQQLGVCESDTTKTVAVPTPLPGTPLPIAVTNTCNVEVVPGHHVSIQADDSAMLGGNQVFFEYVGDVCDGSTASLCQPAGGIVKAPTVVTANFHTAT